MKPKPLKLMRNCSNDIVLAPEDGSIYGGQIVIYRFREPTDWAWVSRLWSIVLPLLVKQGKVELTKSLRTNDRQWLKEQGVLK